MNAAGEYPVHFFYELSKSLKFHTVTMMLESVRLSESFGWVEGDNKLNVSAIFSPLWKEVDAPADLRANLHGGSNSIMNKLNPPKESPAELNPLEELGNSIEAFKLKLKVAIDDLAALARKVKEVQIQQRQKERDFIQARRAIERIRMAI